MWGWIASIKLWNSTGRYFLIQQQQLTQAVDYGIKIYSILLCVFIRLFQAWYRYSPASNIIIWSYLGGSDSRWWTWSEREALRCAEAVRRRKEIRMVGLGSPWHTRHWGASSALFQHQVSGSRFVQSSSSLTYCYTPLAAVHVPGCCCQSPTEK